MYIDSHCHLNFPELRPQIDEICQAMQAAQVHGALIVSTTLEEFDAVHTLAQTHPHFWASVGVHPDNEGVQEPSIADLVQRGKNPKVLAVGETGLDYYRLNGRTVENMHWQRQRFRTHIRAARELGKPLIIHTRSAAEDTLAILREEGETGQGSGRCGGVFHCFTESLATAQAALDIGFYISFSGIITFRNAQALREVVAHVPLERMLIETDSPYLAPTPHRGKLNNPSYVAHVAEQIASIKQLPIEEVAAATTRNFEQLFRVTSQPA
ncbi:MAG: TatD family hydrolase [Brachymonas sp.]|nr:TatD family hydrolase [Brachymonas sp.]